MRILGEMQQRFAGALAGLVDDPAELLAMIRPAQDARFGDYQANLAMPLGKQLGRPPREITAEIVARLEIDDLCEPPEVAGPGFINLRLRSDWMAGQLAAMRRDERLGVVPAPDPRTYVIDYSSPNVAKPMHVGHIRSTVIGDAICRTLRFLGHQVISDNHLGDWGTQFGMIIYGYKHFVDQEAFAADPVEELGRLYKQVNQLVEYHQAQQQLPALLQQLEDSRVAADDAQRSLDAVEKPDKKARKAVSRMRAQLQELEGRAASLRERIQQVDHDAGLATAAKNHPQIAAAVLQETARLHEGDPENVALWQQFLPACREAIDRVYRRLDIQFDVELGESFYHDQLAAVVQELETRQLARESEGAVCLFLDGFDAPMIIRKRDGAFLYATSDLATIRYRMEKWNPDVILYVVDHRQSEHFDKLFAAARLWGYDRVDLRHISFGTVLGTDGRPFKTRSGDVVGLEGLLDEAVERALRVVSESSPAMSEDQRRQVAEVVGHAALKYADLSQNRTSDYVFSYDKMVALDGNTATYMQYSYARVRSIFTRGQVDLAALRAADGPLLCADGAERELALQLLRFHDAVEDSVVDYRPNLLTNFLYDLASSYSRFFEQCPVLKAGSDELRTSRLVLCDLTARTLSQGLSLLGIDVVDQM